MRSARKIKKGQISKKKDKVLLNLKVASTSYIFNVKCEA